MSGGDTFTVMVDEKSIKELAEELVKAYDIERQYRKTASNAKLGKYLPNFQWQSRVDWYKENYKNARN
ncbi:hypothetical protein NQ318_021586 [Aromia moschata]|uniref:Uncharacterized protein n=1 Tax=Aromia moschata TaxID=1265417 RepID=A0AAV8YHZ3_9CUCU|nr:hypothetical protein NQ318_021586 [Aromia moschata]